MPFALGGRKLSNEPGRLKMGNGTNYGSDRHANRVDYMKDWEPVDPKSERRTLFEAAGLGFCYAVAALALLAGVMGWNAASAHPGGLAADGCHNDRKNGGRHCHGSSRGMETVVTSTRTKAYRNCSEARAAGGAPVRRGDPGYGPHLDRDGDGLGCE